MTIYRYRIGRVGHLYIMLPDSKNILLKYRTYEYRRKYGKVVFIRLDTPRVSQFRDDIIKDGECTTFQTSSARGDGLQKPA